VISSAARSAICSPGVELGQQAAEPGLRLEDGAPRRLGGVRGEDELEGDVLPGRGQRLVADPAFPQAREGVGERFAGGAARPLRLASPAHAVVLLGEVRELEEERERTQDLRLLLEVELPHRAGQLGADGRFAGLAGAARDPPDLLLPREQLLALLLDHDAAEQVAEQAHVAAERRVGGHGVRDYAP
jgi:hypothetical protein